MQQTDFNITDQLKSIKGQWSRLDPARTQILTRARECARITIPSILPPLGASQTATLPTPWQSMGARGTNNLASKIVLAILPPNSPFCRMEVDDFTLQEISQSPDAKAEVDEGFGRIERAITTEIEQLAIRVPTFEAIKHLIITGNVCCYIDDDGKEKVFRLDQYVCKRDPMGKLLLIITREQVHPITLPEDVQAKVKAKLEDPEAQVELFTEIKLSDDGKLWEVRQEVAGEVIEDSLGTYPVDECPWLVLRWTAIAGEDYGRGFIEEYLGDLESLETLRQAIVEGSAAAAKILFLVNPNGTTRIKRIAKAESGDIVEGNAADVTVLQLNKYNDFQVALACANGIEQSLAQAFMLMSAIQRDAERVTAEEIRTMVKELEDTLGGVYSVLSQEYQLPLVRRIMAIMSKKHKLPKLPKKIVRPIIVTGVEALGRGNDLNKLMILLQAIGQIPNAQQYINTTDLLKRIGTGLGINTDGLIHSEDEMNQMQQQSMMAQGGLAALPGVSREIAKGMMQQPQGDQGQAAPPDAGGGAPTQ